MESIGVFRPGVTPEQCLHKPLMSPVERATRGLGRGLLTPPGEESFHSTTKEVVTVGSCSVCLQISVHI